MDKLSEILNYSLADVLLGNEQTPFNNYALLKRELNKLVEGYSWKLLLETISFCKNDIEYSVLNKLSHSSDYGKVRYISTILENKLPYVKTNAIKFEQTKENMKNIDLKNKVEVIYEDDNNDEVKSQPKKVNRKVTDISKFL